MTFKGWAIDRDYLDGDTSHSRVGYGQRDAESDTTLSNYQGFRRSIEVATDLKAREVDNAVRFRLLDDDGEVYYGGAISRDWLDGEDEFRAFAPLRFGEADAGAVELQYHYGDGNWRTL